jgi:hypothetical protein
MGNRERGHQIHHISFLYAVAIGDLRTASLEELISFQSKQNVVVSKVVSWIQVEVFIFVLCFKRNSYLALEYHVHLRELLTFPNYGLVVYENSAVELAYKKTYELIATV